MRKILLLVTMIILLSTQAYADTFPVTWEDNTEGFYLDYYNETQIEDKAVNEAVARWCKYNNPSSIKALMQRLTNYILRKAPYSNDGLKSYSAFGVINGKAVCMGYSLFVKRVLDYKGIESVLVIDRIKNHMYNRIDGINYDVTAEHDRRVIQREMIKVQRILDMR
jgi:hypothetical protein